MAHVPSAPADLSTALSTAALPDAARRRGVAAEIWTTLCNSLYPGARPESVGLVVDYCRARKLDPLKKPCHIVQMEVRDAKTNTYAWRDVILPGIYELRITARRTGEYMGHDAPTWGPALEYRGIQAFEWVELTIYRYHPKATAGRIAFTVRVYFREVVALARDGKPNARWTRAPFQMLLKCCEAAALREAFPDELGGEHAAEELDGLTAPDHDVIDAAPVVPRPEGFSDWFNDLLAVADEGYDKLLAAWQTDTPRNVDCRKYLAATDPTRWDEIKGRAERVDAGRQAPPPAATTTAAPTLPGIGGGDAF